MGRAALRSRACGLRGLAVAALGFDEAGARALVVHNDGRAEVRGIGDDRGTWLIDVPAGEITGRFIGDGTRVFATITDEAGGFGAVAGAGVWDGRSGRQLVNFASTPPSAYGLAISANGSRVLDAFGGNVLNIDTGAVVYNYQPTLLQGRPSIAGLSSDGALIANFLPNARVEVRSIDDAATSVVLVGFERLDEDFSSPPAFSPDGRLIAATNGLLGRVWDAKSGRLVATFGEGQRLGRLGLPRFSAGGAELAVITGAEPRGNLGEASGRAIGLWRTPLPLLALRADLVARTCAVMGATGAGRFRAEDLHAGTGLGLNANSDACSSPSFLLLVVRALGL